MISESRESVFYNPITNKIAHGRVMSNCLHDCWTVVLVVNKKGSYCVINVANMSFYSIKKFNLFNLAKARVDARELCWKKLCDL